MSQTDDNSQGLKPKFSRLAMVSALLSLLGIIILYMLRVSAAFPGDIFTALKYILRAVLSALVSVILGLAALVKTSKVNSGLTGRKLAMLSLIAALICFVFGWRCANNAYFCFRCSMNFGPPLRRAFRCYAIDNEGQ